MHQKSYLGLLLAGMTLGTAWAIRGQFGHEQGAAWAGSIGALGIILLAKRPDWYNKALAATLASAIGWGLGGLMSYGIVVGYGRDTEFINVYYGLLMLFVIGGLYGYLGGGLFGIALAHESPNSIPFAQLLVEMVVMAVVFYFFMIEEFEWLMTPPRSELWAACMGAAVGMTWFLVRRGLTAPLRVAVFAGLGGGFGFAFGNFLQVLGQLSEIHFNFWNVMEYSLGFFGGVGMAYGTFTTSWEPSATTQTKSKIWFPLLMVTLVIPFVVWQQSFESQRLQQIFGKLTSLTDKAYLIGGAQYVAIGLVLLFAIFWWRRFYVSKTHYMTYSAQEIYAFLLGHWGLYILFSLLITGAFMSGYRIEQYLYIVNWAVVAFLIRGATIVFTPRSINISKWMKSLGAVITLLALLALVLISSHGELTNAHKRFNAPKVLSIP